MVLTDGQWEQVALYFFLHLTAALFVPSDNRFPFSLFSESKGSKECETKKTGDVVTDGMDKTIGRAGKQTKRSLTFEAQL